MNQKISIEQIIKEALKLWRATMGYNILFSICYFGLYFIFSYGIANYTGIWQKFYELYPTLLKNQELYVKRVEALIQTPEFATTSLMLLICSGFIFPLHIGLLNIIQKTSKQQKIAFNDLLEGFSGLNFFKYSIYYIFWVMIANAANAVFFPVGILLKILWIVLTLFVVPLMYFKKEPMGTALLWNFSVLKKNFGVIFLCVLSTIAFNILGLFTFMIGYLFTFPFWCAIIYVLFKYIFPEEIQTNNN